MFEGHSEAVHIVQRLTLLVRTRILFCRLSENPSESTVSNRLVSMDFRQPLKMIHARYSEDRCKGYKTHS